MLMKSRTEALLLHNFYYVSRIFLRFLWFFCIIYYRLHINGGSFGERGVAATGGRGAAAALSPRQAPQERGSD